MRIRAAAVASLAAVVACGSGLFREYEYEEDLYLSLDGSATLYVNTSIQAINVLRGTTFDTAPDASFDRTGVERYFTSPTTSVGRITTSERSGRRFVHVRIDVSDVLSLGDREPFAWSEYQFGRDGELMVFEQRVGSTGQPAASTELADDLVVAFRLHAPSRIVYHNAGAENLRRGNILVWEQTLGERLRGTPIEIDVRLEPESILYQTLLLFAASGVAVAVMFAAVIWWLTRSRKSAG